MTRLTRGNRGICLQSGKIQHFNARDAQTHVLDLLLFKGLHARFYRCRTCKAFHVTTKK